MYISKKKHETKQKCIVCWYAPKTGVLASPAAGGGTTGCRTASLACDATAFAIALFLPPTGAATAKLQRLFALFFLPLLASQNRLGRFAAAVAQRVLPRGGARHAGHAAHAADAGGARDAGGAADATDACHAAAALRAVVVAVPFVVLAVLDAVAGDAADDDQYERGEGQSAVENEAGPRVVAATAGSCFFGEAQK